MNLGESYNRTLPPFIQKLFFLKVIENANLLLCSFLVLQKIVKPFMVSNIISLCIYTLMCYLTIGVNKMGLNGYLISFATKQCAELLINLCIIYKFSQINFILPRAKSVMKQIPKHFFMCFYNSIGIYGAIFSFEVNTYLAATFNNVIYVVTWQYYSNVLLFIIQVTLGFSELNSAYCGYLIGKED